MSFSEFVSLKNKNDQFCYLSNMLHANIGDALLTDAKMIDWSFLDVLCDIVGAGLPMQQNIWIGSNGCVTPLHYDESFNFHYMIRGTKKFLLFAPLDGMQNLYPFPVA